MSSSLTQKILITLGFLFAYRVLAYIPVPGVDLEVIKQFFANNQNNALGLANMFSGNAIERLSIISLGVMPYITASIVMELLAATFPALAQMKKERDGMQKYMQIIRYATIFITIVQAIGVAFGLQQIGGTGQSAILIDMTSFVVLTIFSMLAGTMLLMWFGEQITQRGIGNGISLIIFAGIVSGIPAAIGNTIAQVNSGSMDFAVVIAIFLIMIATILIIIYVELGERRIPISYSRKTLLQNKSKRIMNYIPIRVNISGVIPPIFASAILMFPLTILKASTHPIAMAIADALTPGGFLFNFLMFILVIFFAFFYASIQFNAKEIAENLKRQGGFIPGVRPGKQTEEFLNDVATKLTVWGALYLATISTVPFMIINKLGASFYFGGTAVLIVVQVALDTMRKIEAQRMMSQYETLGHTGL
ncbi:MAG: preprotein translocase subunit SecY [Epsilonproteobacteria bacterium]|nr:preprotein translocase subunit SecY [Campylobacterota bacterium]